jgi:hypothetical protein
VGHGLLDPPIIFNFRLVFSPLIHLTYYYTPERKYYQLAAIKCHNTKSGTGTVDLSVKESVLQLNPKGKVDVQG